MRISQVELTKILNKHLKWLRSEEDGSRAVLTGAVLRDADLTGAVLTGAVLRDADLSDAVLTGAVLRDGDLRGLTIEQYQEIAVRYREHHPNVPVIPDLDKQICEIVNSGEGQLDMSNWHKCKTTHCRAGWAIYLAGDAGYELEKKKGSEIAGGMIYRASTGRWPNFFADNDTALADICKWGAIENNDQENA